MFASGACGGRPACELDDTLLTKVCAASPQFKHKLHKLGAQPNPADESGLKKWRHESRRLLRDLVRSTLRLHKTHGAAAGCRYPAFEGSAI